MVGILSLMPHLLEPLRGVLLLLVGVMVVYTDSPVILAVLAVEQALLVVL